MEPILKVEWKTEYRGYLYIRHGDIETRFIHFNDKWFSFEPSFEKAVGQAIREVDRLKAVRESTTRRVEAMRSRVAQMEDRLLRAMRKVT